MSEADYIVVLDTGSTDGTYEKLKADPRVTRVERKIFNPWRFDVPRNESMKLAPEDTDIFVCTDLDETFNPGWADAVRWHWTEGITNINYLYAWNHIETGAPNVVMVYMKIHSRGYHWKYPVHEMLVPDDGFVEHKVEVLDGSIYLHHWQDLSKPRKYYMDLLKLGVEEFPEDAYMRTFLGREYLIQGNIEEGLKHYNVAVTLPDLYNPDRPLIMLDAFMYMVGAYETIGDYDNALKYCKEFIKRYPDFRDPYFFMGEIYNLLGLFTLAEACVLTGFKYGVNHYSFVEKYGAWLGWGYELLGYIYYNMNDKKESLKNFETALKYKPSSEELLSMIKRCIIEE